MDPDLELVLERIKTYLDVFNTLVHHHLDEFLTNEGKELLEKTLGIKLNCNEICEEEVIIFARDVLFHLFDDIRTILGEKE